MKLGGLFSGIGGFELAWTQLGHEVAWMCEIDKNARKVLEARFPGVPIYEDIEQLDPAEVEAVDVLTGGSPCQGFSVAGTRSGLEHGESRLFADYIRIMNGLAERGLQWALWENVPGVLSITNDDGEKTYEHVVAALVGGVEPVRLGQGRWNTGLADGGGRAVAWRVLDSRYFGVAQRRRRVFACVAFGGVAADRAGRALLAKPEGVSGDSSSGGSEGEGVARSVAERFGVPRFAGPLTATGMNRARGTESVESSHALVDAPSSGFRMTAFGQYEDDNSASTLKQRDHKDATDLVAQAFNWQSGGDARGLDLTDETSALTTQQTPAVLLPEAKMLFVRNGVEVDRHGKKAGKGALIATEEAPTLDAGNHWALFQPQALDKGVAYDGYNQTLEVGVHRSLRIGRDSSDFVASKQTLEYGVRRLTPVECERLQAFPDGWTEPAVSDSARYKALGNAVTVNTVRWVLGRMLEQS